MSDRWVGGWMDGPACEANKNTLFLLPYATHPNIGHVKPRRHYKLPPFPQAILEQAAYIDSRGTTGQKWPDFHTQLPPSQVLGLNTKTISSPVF
jgi:hypothetical protein